MTIRERFLLIMLVALIMIQGIWIAQLQMRYSSLNRDVIDFMGATNSSLRSVTVMFKEQQKTNETTGKIMDAHNKTITILMRRIR